MAVVRGRKAYVRYFFIDPKDGQVLKGSDALIEGIIARRRLVPDWAGMKIRMVQIIAVEAGGELRIGDIKGSYMHFEDEGFWDQPREAMAAMALWEAYQRDNRGGTDRDRFLDRRAAATKWHVDGEIFNAIQTDIEGGGQSPRLKGKVPWEWAPATVTLA